MLGPAAEVALPALLAALQDAGCVTNQTATEDFTTTTYRYVREQAVRALARIKPAATAAAVVPVIRELTRCPSLVTSDANGDCLDTDHVRFAPDELAVFGAAAVEGSGESAR